MALPLADKVTKRAEPVRRAARGVLAGAEPVRHIARGANAGAEPVRRVARGMVAIAAPHFTEAGKSWAAWAARTRMREAPRAPLERYQDELRAATGIDRRREIVRLSNLASAYRRRSELAQAQVCATRAVDMAREVGDDRLLGLTLNGLGLVQSRHPVPGPAVRAFEEAREVADRIGDRQIEGKILANLGSVHVRLGSPQAARATWAEALGVLSPESSAHQELAEWLGEHPEADPAEDETAERLPEPNA